MGASGPRAQSVIGTLMPNLRRHTTFLGSRFCRISLRTYFSQAPWSFMVGGSRNESTASALSKSGVRASSPQPLAIRSIRGRMFCEPLSEMSASRTRLRNVVASWLERYGSSRIRRWPGVATRARKSGV